MIKEREEGIERLYPTLLNSRYYYLTELRRQIEQVVRRFIDQKQGLVLAGRKIQQADVFLFARGIQNP